MRNRFQKYAAKLFFQQWILGISRHRIEDIIRSRVFDPAITWLPVASRNRMHADPFLYKVNGSGYGLLYEDYSFSDKYGKIAVAAVDEQLKPVDPKIILDTHSHLSYPLVFSEQNKVYMFPEAAASGRLSCYEYEPAGKSLTFLQDVIDLPLLDSTILKHNGKYWIFATHKGKDADNKLYVYYSDRLLGSYTAHKKNPVKTGLTGTRPAGNFITVDGQIYRPAQNSQYVYGGSMTINKLTRLDEEEVNEEFYMSVNINEKNKLNKGIRGIHTLNCVGDVIVVDGIKWRFSPLVKLKQWAMKFNRQSPAKNRQ